MTARELASSREGQMVVEMAVVAPVMIVVAIVVLNLMWFLEAAARFDRVAPDAVVALAVSPVGMGEAGSQEHALVEAIRASMAGTHGVRVEVAAQSAWEAADEGQWLAFAPHLTRYVCTMVYEPWPLSLSIAGVDAGIPLELRHQRTFVVDRFRPGVVF